MALRSSGHLTILSLPGLKTQVSLSVVFHGYYCFMTQFSLSKLLAHFSKFKHHALLSEICVFNWTDRCNSLVQGKIIAKIVNIHINNFKVLLQNNWTIFIQTWHKASILVQREFKQISQTGGNEYIFEFRMVPFDISLWTKMLV